MLKHKEMNYLLTAAALLLGGSASAQGLGNAPYSRIGLGEYNPNVGGVRQAGMGGAGLAAPNAINVNELNPALLCYVNRTTFEAGFNGQYKTVRNATAQGRSGSGTLGYLALAVPLSAKWGAAVGLKPLSAVEYESNILQAGDGTRLPIGDFALNQYKGTGGLSEAYFGQGLLLGKNLSLGATASYVFGTVDETNGTTIQQANGITTDKAVDRIHTHYSDFSFRAGAHYRHALGSKLFANVAGVYSFAANLAARRTSTQERQDLNGALTAAPTQTSDVRGYSLRPAQTQLGLSIDNNKNFSFNLDASQQQWSKFSSFGVQDQPLRDTWRGAIGGEFTPDPGSVDHYFKRVSYRVGASLAQMPYYFGGQTLYDRNVTWGFAFPLPSSSALDATTFSLAFAYGRRGNTERVASGGSNVQESYIRGTLGVTLNNRWFIKRRLQ